MHFIAPGWRRGIFLLDKSTADKQQKLRRWCRKWCRGSVRLNKTRDVTAAAVARHTGIRALISSQIRDTHRPTGQTKEAQKRQKSFGMSKVLLLLTLTVLLIKDCASFTTPSIHLSRIFKETIFCLGHRRILLYWRKLRYKVRMNNKNIFILHSYITQFENWVKSLEITRKL